MIYLLLFCPGDDEATCTWEDEELEPGMRKKRKKKVRPPGGCVSKSMCKCHTLDGWMGVS